MLTKDEALELFSLLTQKFDMLTEKHHLCLFLPRKEHFSTWVSPLRRRVPPAIEQVYILGK